MEFYKTQHKHFFAHTQNVLPNNNPATNNKNGKAYQMKCCKIIR